MIMRKSTLATIVGSMVICTLFSNCASIVSKTAYPLYVHTDPAGATVSITNKKGKEIYKGTSPATVKLKSGDGFFAKAEYLVKLTSPGYAERVVPVNFKLNGWYFGNIVFGGLIGLLIVDPLTGAMWKIQDPVVDETLAPLGSNAKIPTLKIIPLNSIPESWKKSLVRLD